MATRKLQPVRRKARVQRAPLAGGSLQQQGVTRAVAVRMAIAATANAVLTERIDDFSIGGVSVSLPVMLAIDQRQLRSNG